MKEMSIKEHPPHHVPVLLDACLRLMDPKSGESYLDLTAGYGGHAGAFLGKTENYRQSCLVDRDEFAISQLSHLAAQGVRLIHDDFVSASQQLVDEGRQFRLILLDLGVSSPQLDIPARGFSFTHDGPLDMRMDQRQSVSARDIVNTYSQTKLAELIETYGEEHRSVARRYAEAIVKARPIDTTNSLAETILRAHVGRWQKTHPATRTFQALRIAVNRELEQVEQVLSLLPHLLEQGGRVGIISFHSLEDRLVKRYLHDQAQSGYEAELSLVNTRPVTGLEDDHNPRARSAKLRVAVKI